MANTLEEHLLRFISLLRQNGVRVGSAEALDALHALELVDLGSKQEVRTALKATLLKRQGDENIFDQFFASYFAPPEKKQEMFAELENARAEQEQKMAEAEDVFTFKGETLDLSPEEKLIYTSLPEHEKQKIKEFMERTEAGKNVEKKFRPVLESVVKSSLRYWKRNLDEERKEKPLPDSEDREFEALMNDGAGEGKGRSSSALKEKDMQHLSGVELARAESLVLRMSRQLATRISRRYQHSKRRRRLDVRRTIRDNLRYGGSLYRLRHKSLRIQKPKLLLLCDVSGSMIRYTSFILQFVYGLSTAVSGIQTFLFADDLEKVSFPVHDSNFKGKLYDYVNQSDIWGGGTQLARALHTLRTKYAEELLGDRILIIVSDTKTTRVEEALQELQHISGQVKEVIWLNTLPQAEWDSFKGVETFRRHTLMFPCNTLADLEKLTFGRLLA